MSSLNSPCAACKSRRQKCTQECVFAPYFPPDQLLKFAQVHKVFGASNVAKLLSELNATQREDAVNSLAYEAEARLKDPVYGCVGLISILQHRLKQVHSDLLNARKELAHYIGPSAMQPMLQHPGFIQQQQQHPNNSSAYSVFPYNMPQPMGIQGVGPQLMMREPQLQQQNHQQQQQMLDAQQQQYAAVVAAREQEMLRTYEQQQHSQQQHELVRFSQLSVSGFNQMSSPVSMSPSLALGASYDNYQIQGHPQDPSSQLQPQLLLQQQQHEQLQQETEQQQPQATHQQQQRAGSEEGRSVGPSC